MSKFQQKDGEGALFQNSRKETAQHPDYSGSIMVAGVEYWLSGWKKESKDGTKKYLSLSVRPKKASTPETKAEPKPEEDFKDDIDLPF